MVFETLNPKIRELIEAKGWDQPTEPQKKAIPAIHSGEDVLLTAPTGIGKTESAMLPLLDRLLEEDNAPISMLYITPLRALNRDMFDRFLWWCRKLGLEVAIRHGDTSDYVRRKQAEYPEQIFVTTPETLQAILPGSKMKKHLKNVKYVVVDEIHELVESKRGVQLSLGLERLKELCGQPQMIGLSATVGTPTKVARFLSKDAKVIQALEEKDFNIKVDSPTVTKKDIELSEKIFVDKDIAANLREINNLIESSKSTLVFTNTRQTSEVLSSRLRKIKDKGYEHAIHHSSLSKDVRIQNEENFKEGDLKSIICTSSLELGIDIGNIDLVIQYGSPRRVDKLLQRIGRSGHQVGGMSDGRIIALDPDDILEAAVIARKAIHKELEPTKFHTGSLDVLANQIIGFCLDEYSIDWRKIYDRVKNSIFYEDLSEEKFNEVIGFLSSMRYIWAEDELNRSKKAWRYYYENLSTIPDIYQYRVIDTVEKNDIGQLDESFVAEYGEPGTTFVMRGRSWKILTVDEGEVYVEPVDSVDSAIPAWEGELIPVPQDIAREVAELRRKTHAWLQEFGEEEVIERIKSQYPITKRACEKIIDYIKESEDEIAAKNEILIEQEDKFTIVHSCNGSLVNQTLSKFLAYLLIRKKGSSIAVKNDPYRIMIQGGDIDTVKKIIEDATANDLEFIINASIKRSQIFRWRFIHVAKRFGAVKSRAKWDQVNISGIIDSYKDSPIFEEAKNEVFHDKLDIESTRELIEKIEAGKVTIRECDTGKIGNRGLTYKFRELLGPEKPKEEIFKAFKRRILNNKLRLMCINCGKYSLTKKVRDLEEYIKCPVCGSGRITVLKPYERDKENLIKDYTKNKELSEKEMKTVEKLERKADYVLTYGKKFVVALSGKGVGPETAIRILAKQHVNQKKFFEAIMEKEKEYTRTKKYWS